LELVVCVLGALVEAYYAGDEDVAAFEVGVGLGDVVWSDADALGVFVLVSLAARSKTEWRLIQQSWRLWPLRIARRFAWGMHPV
jgi:hypothetical protein